MTDLHPSQIVETARQLVDSIASKGLPYAYGLYVYLLSDTDYAYGNTRETLEEAFGEDVATRVLSTITRAFADIVRRFKYIKITVDDQEFYPYKYLSDYVYDKYIAPVIKDEISRRLNTASSEDIEVLSVASRVVVMLRGKEGTGMGLYVSAENSGLLVFSYDTEKLSNVVSAALERNIADVRRLFCRYLLGAILDSESRRHRYYHLMLHPIAIKFIDELSAKASNYVKIPSEVEISKLVRELYRTGNLLKLSIIHQLVDKNGVVDFTAYFYGLPREFLCKEAYVKGLVYNCTINPLVYESVKKAISELHKETASELLHHLGEIFRQHGYDELHILHNQCVFRGPKNVFIHVEPWPNPLPIILPSVPPGTIKLVVTQGKPSESILEYIKGTLHRDFLWIFIERNTAYIASTTYSHEVHSKVIEILAKRFNIEFLGQPPREVESLVKRAPIIPAEVRTVEAVERVRGWSEITRYYKAKDVLESIVAAALSNLGFSVRTDYRVKGRGGSEIEVDVWGERLSGDLKVIVYASCKNWDTPVEVSVVREEIGRIMQMLEIPHIRVLVAPKFTEQAKKEALRSGFLVIETGVKVTEDNADKAFGIVYSSLSDLFTSIAPKWLQSLAKRVLEIAEELRRISNELAGSAP